jgi:hypothetical protein
MNIKGFKPNLIPNNPKVGFGEKERDSVIMKNGGYGNYTANLKKDGCRLQLGIAPLALSRSLKQPGSDLVSERFFRLNQICINKKISLDAEFYMHGLKFNEIFRYFSNTDVTRESYADSLEKEREKNPKKFEKDYNGRNISFLTTFHDNLKAWVFDGTVLDMPELIGYEDRMTEIRKRLNGIDLPFMVFPEAMKIQDKEGLNKMYEAALELGYEGLVLTCNSHAYKYGRNSITQGTLLKMKDDAIEYDGVILSIEEGTQVKDGIERGLNELGRSTTSNKKEDREPNNKASGFWVQYESIGIFKVSLRGFDDEAKAELLKNKESYIGRHFKYTGMIPVKDYPRHAHFKCWRDSK